MGEMNEKAKELITVNKRELDLDEREERPSDTLLIQNVEPGRNIAYKIWTNSPTKYTVSPHKGVLEPMEKVNVRVRRCEGRGEEKERFLIAALPADAIPDVLDNIRPTPHHGEQHIRLQVSATEKSDDGEVYEVGGGESSIVEAESRITDGGNRVVGNGDEAGGEEWDRTQEEEGDDLEDRLTQLIAEKQELEQKLKKLPTHNILVSIVTLLMTIAQTIFVYHIYLKYTSPETGSVSSSQAEDLPASSSAAMEWDKAEL